MRPCDGVSSVAANREIRVDRLTLEPVGIIHSGTAIMRKRPSSRSARKAVPAGSGLPPVRRGPRRPRRILAPPPDLIAAPGRRDRGLVAGPSPLKVVPFLDDVPRGVFATRNPCGPIRRPEPGAPGRAPRELLEVDDLDVLDGTPLLDIKPYVEGFDLRVGTRAGWLTRWGDSETFAKRGGRLPTLSRGPASGESAKAVRERLRRRPRPCRPTSGTACRSSSRPPCRSPPAGCGPAPGPWRPARSPGHLSAS